MENKKLVWTGRIISTIIMFPFLMGIMMSLNTSKTAEMVQGFEHMGIPISLRWPIFGLMLISVVFYIIPQTAILGAILLTGYMGGAILTHLRIGEPVYMQTAIGVLAWLGIWLREPRLRAIL